RRLPEALAANRSAASAETTEMPDATLELLDWKRRIFELYAEIRSAADPVSAWRRWSDIRDELFRSHPQSPLPPERRASFEPVEYFPYEPALRFLADVEPVAPEPVEIAGTAGSRIRFTRFGLARFELGELELY